MKSEMDLDDPSVLTCWKDIARYLGKGVRTVQRWEREFGLPVRRPNGVHHKSAVVAQVRDLEMWLDSRWSERSVENKDGKVIVQAELSELIKRSRNLRAAHMMIMEETSVALDSLIQSFNELEQTRQRNVPPPAIHFSGGTTWGRPS